jgi:hypothetical protein
MTLLSVGFSTAPQRSHVSSPQFVLNVWGTAIAKALGIGRASVYRVLADGCGRKTEANVA